MDQGASAGESVAGGGVQSLEEVWTFPVEDKVCVCVCVCVSVCVI